jgi:hypothetical protein
MDSGGIYNAGIFTCPAMGAGLYNYNLTYDYGSSPTITLRAVIYIASTSTYSVETLPRFNSYSFIDYMKPGDQLYIRIVNSSLPSVIGNGSFMGYRINQ